MRPCATDLLEESVGADDDRAELSEEELAALEDAQVEEVTRRTAGGYDPTAKERAGFWWKAALAATGQPMRFE